jgi:ribonuclease P protein component
VNGIKQGQPQRKATGKPLHQQSPGATLPRSARLRKPSEFKRVFNRPMVSSDRCFKVLAQGGGGQGPRLGMAVSRQVDRKATGRNRIKRIIRESFRHYFAAGGPALDFVVLPRKESATICNGQLFRSLDKHWARIVAQLPEDPAGRRTAT